MLKSGIVLLWHRGVIEREDQARESGKNAPYMLVVAKAPLSETG